MHVSDLKKTATRLRIDILKMIHKASSGHTGGSLSVIDILVALYFGEINGQKVLNCDSEKPDCEDRDYCVLSKGHASPALYAVLAEVGFFPKEELDHFRQINSLLQGHPVIKVPGVCMTTGSLGQGLAVSNGIALSLRIDKKLHRVYCILGDGECQEGQIWEAAMAASHYRLDNLCAFLDFNKLQIDGEVKRVMNIEPIVDKFNAFGWKIIRVTDGHNFDMILDAIDQAWKTVRRPTIIVADTIKGKGVPFAENKVSYHGVALSDEEMEVAVPGLEKEITL